MPGCKNLGEGYSQCIPVSMLLAHEGLATSTRSAAGEEAELGLTASGAVLSSIICCLQSQGFLTQSFHESKAH